jgi:hypothetical protein
MNFPIRAALCLTALLCSARPAAAADAPTSPPATRPARTVTKISVPLAGDSKETVSVLVDTHDAPEFKDWGLKAGNYALKWYPELARQLESDGYTPPREFTLLIKKDKGVAATSGGVITVNTDYLKNHTDDLGMVAHELVHVIQKYKRAPRDAGWLVEGIADYLRYFVVEPDSKNARFNAKTTDYTRGYQPAAALLNFAEKRKPGTVAKLNAALRAGTYDKDTFKTLTGSTPQDLWAEFAK